MIAEVGDLRLRISSDPRLLAVARGVMQVWLELVAFDAERLPEVVLAVDEACANAIRHAYGGRTDGEVELVLSLSEERMEITVNDQGKPCPPDCAAYRPLERPEANDVVPGGLGVKLIHQVFDEVRFCPGSSGGNCVTMRLHRRPEYGNHSED